MAAVALDTIPDVGRPDAVATALTEALALRTKHREASEALAAATAELEQAEAADVAAAAERIRSGESPGNLSAAISKARHRVEIAQRTAAAVDLANRTAGEDLVSALRSNADDWLAALDETGEQAREQAVAALDSFDEAKSTIVTAAAAAHWLRNALDDGRFDRRVGGVVAASIAPSTRRVTANSEPLRVDDLLGYLREAITPPQAATAAPTLHVETAET